MLFRRRRRGRRRPRNLARPAGTCGGAGLDQIPPPGVAMFLVLRSRKESRSVREVGQKGQGIRVVRVLVLNPIGRGKK